MTIAKGDDGAVTAVPWKRIVSIKVCLHAALADASGAFHGRCCDCEWLFPWKHGVASSGGLRGKVLGP